MFLQREQLFAQLENCKEQIDRFGTLMWAGLLSPLYCSKITKRCRAEQVMVANVIKCYQSNLFVNVIKSSFSS